MAGEKDGKIDRERERGRDGGNFVRAARGLFDGRPGNPETALDPIDGSELRYRG